MNGGEHPLVSIVIPSYRRPDLIVRAVKSALDQSYGNTEILVVDDNGRGHPEQRSTEEVLLREICDDRVRYLVNENNLGGGGARNVGITNANGQFVALLDDDEDWLPEKIEKQVQCFLRSNSDVGVVDTGFYDILSDGTTVEHYPEMQGGILDQLIFKRGRRAPKLSTILCKRTVLTEVGMFDVRFRARQDLDLYIRLARVCRFESVPELLATKRADADTRISGNLASRIQGSRLLYEKIRTDLAERPSAHAAYLFREASLLRAAGQFSEARKTLGNAGRAARYNPLILLPRYLTFLRRSGRNRDRSAES